MFCAMTFISCQVMMGECTQRRSVGEDLAVVLKALTEIGHFRGDFYSVLV